MTKYKIILSASVQTTREVIVEDGDDYEGRPIGDRYDATDYAYDVVYGEEPDLDWRVDQIREIND